MGLTVARAGGLPTLIQHVAHDLMDKGNLDESRAISMAVGIVHNWAHGHDGKGNAVSAPVVAEAVKAIAEWDAKRAEAHASHSNMSRRFARVVELARYAIFGPRDLSATSAADLAGPSTAEREAAVKKGQALPADNGGGRFPIRNESDLRKAIQAVGRATDSSGQHTEAERTKVRSFICKRARALGLDSLIPPTWNWDGTLKS